jgi:hypothetical protein
VTKPRPIDLSGTIGPLELLADIELGEANSPLSLRAMADALIEIAVRTGPRACACTLGGKRVLGCPGDYDPLNVPDWMDDNVIYPIAARALGIL